MRVRRFDLRNGEDTQVSAVQLDLGFRRSNVDRDQVVLEAELRLATGDREAAEATIAEIVRLAAREPARGRERRIGVREPARRLGRAVSSTSPGARDCAVGTAEVSTKHANFIQADDGGSADDIFALMLEVQRGCTSAPACCCGPRPVSIGFAPSALDVERY